MDKNNLFEVNKIGHLRIYLKMEDSSLKHCNFHSLNILKVCQFSQVFDVFFFTFRVLGNYNLMESHQDEVLGCLEVYI